MSRADLMRCDGVPKEDSSFSEEKEAKRLFPRSLACVVAEAGGGAGNQDDCGHGSPPGLVKR